MNEEDVQKPMENNISSPRKKSTSKISTDEPEKPTKNGEKKRKAPKVPKMDSEKIDNDDTQTISAADQEISIKPKKKRTPKVPKIDSEKIDNDDTQTTSVADQEIPVKPKKKRTPKVEVNNENVEPISTDQPIKKKKSKAPKIPPPPALDDDFQIVDNPTIDELEPNNERKLKTKKSKKSKPKVAGSFEDLAGTNLDETYSNNQELDENINGDMPEYSADIFPSSEYGTSDYEQAIIDTYNNLQSKVNFSQYVGDDKWCIIYLPKTARTEPKSRLRKMLPGGNKDNTPTGNSLKKKPTAPKENLLKRLRTSVNSLVRDENNLIFGERPNYDMVDEEDDPDGVDTDDLHRVAQKLRELEDQDREINPEFLVLRDGKTVYGVHEADLDGKVKLSTRKPIYDRYADQRPDEQGEKKKLLARLKHPFTRNKDVKDSKSENTTPDPRANRKAARKSLTDEIPTTTADDPMMI